MTVLGCATPCPSVDNPCSGYLVSGGDTRVWVDAGSGTLAELQRHVRLDDLDAIWISHMHADHSADLLTAYYGALFAMSCATARLVKRIRRGCGSCDSLTRLAEGCDVLLCEAESA